MSRNHDKQDRSTATDRSTIADRLREKLGIVRAAIDSIQKQFGKGAVMMMSGDEQPSSTGVIPSGSAGLDAALGIGGYPRGRVVELFGPESSGKTTLALTAIAQVQLAGGVAAFIDAEHAIDVGYARKLGVRVEELLISQPDTGEQALEIAETLVRSGGVDLVVVDSVAALVPRAELEGDMGDQHVGLQARLMSQALRKLTACVARTNSTIVFINQIRMKIGVMFGSPETTTGGNALKFYASVRLDIRRIGAVKDGDTVVGSRTRVRVVKNKCAPPFREAEFDIVYGSGIARDAELIDMATSAGVLERSGSWLSFGGERIGQGRDRAAEFLRANPATRTALETALVQRSTTPATTTTTAAA